MTPETEELFKQWLKLEIAKTKWSLVFRVVTLILLAVGVVMGAQVLEPIVSRQLQFLDTIQTSVINSSGTQAKNQPGLFEVIRSLTPEQKEQVEQMLQENR